MLSSAFYTQPESAKSGSFDLVGVRKNTPLQDALYYLSFAFVEYMVKISATLSDLPSEWRQMRFIIYWTLRCIIKYNYDDELKIHKRSKQL